MSDESITDEAGRSIAVWDLAPSDGGAPGQIQVWSTRAAELVAEFPLRYRIALPGDTAPTERSDGKPIDEKAGLQ